MISLFAAMVLARSSMKVDREGELRSFLSKPCLYSDVWRGIWKGMKESSPCEVLHEAERPPMTFAQAARLLGDAWDLPTAAAVPLLEAELYSRTVGAPPNDARARSWISSRFEAALAAAPASASVLHAIVAGQGDGAAESLIEKSLGTFPHPASVALTLLDGTYPSVRLTAALIALKDDPSVLPALLLPMSEADIPLAAKLTFLELARARGATGEHFVTLAHSVLETAMAEGLPELALDVWSQLPRDAQAPSLKGRVDPASSNPRRHLSLELELAMAAVETGRLGEPGALAARVPEPDWSSHPSPRSEADCTTPTLHEALLRSRDQRRAASDPFQLARALQTCYRGPPFPRLFSNLLAKKQSGLAHRLRRKALRERLSARLAPSYPPRVLAFMAPAQQRLRDAEKDHLDELRKTLASGEAARRSSAPDFVEAAVSAAAWSPWIEKKLPAGMPVSPVPRGDDGSPTGIALPRGYWAVRVERKKNDVWVVAASQNLDPTGEVSPGGYWLLHSTNAGKAWEPPVYTGLHVFQPYVVVSKSALPLIHGDSVRMEVRTKEVDPSTITFPPIALRFKRESSGLYLEASLEDLRRDSDHDGLTDLVEQRLLTDPQSPDSDKDGIGDGEDSLPTIPGTTGSPPRVAELITEVLSSIFRSGRPQAIIVGSKSQPLPFNARPPPVSDDDVLFVVGESADFVGVWTSRRVIVLSEDQVARVSRERGLIYPMQLDIVMDEKGEVAQINWSERWRGGSFNAHRANGQWVLVGTGGWIT